jgi:hypothetical protein
MNVSLKHGKLTVAIAKREQKMLEDTAQMCHSITQLTALPVELRGAAEDAYQAIDDLLALASTFPTQKGLPGLEEIVAEKEEIEARK